MKYTVYMKHTEYMEMEVEADDFEEAQDIAEGADYDDFKYCDGECVLIGITDETGKRIIVGF